MPTSTRWVKPLKRSEKVRLRKELEIKKKFGITKERSPKLEEHEWTPSGLPFGGKSRVTEDRWEYKLIC